MKKIETLLSLEMGRKFDTPKKLNRSSKAVPAEIVQQLEDGTFSSEMLEDLGRSFPIFKYKTCVTIHGRWPEVIRERIGGYKNVIQNKNGSLEIRWSAIDQEKVSQLVEAVRIKRDWSYSEDSTGRSFYKARPVTKETIGQVRAELEPISKVISELPIYGHVSLYLAQDMFRTYLVLSVYPLAIKQADMTQVTEVMTGQKYEDVVRMIQENKEAERMRDEERKREYEEYMRKAKEKEDKIRQEVSKMRENLSHLKDFTGVRDGIAVQARHINSASGDYFGYVFYRYDGPGSFGRVKFSKAYGHKLEPETWKEKKQVTAEEYLKLTKGFKVYKVAQPAATQRIPEQVLFSI